MTKNVLGECQHCGGQFEFQAEHAGQTADCPHCGQPTELLLASPPEAPSLLGRKLILFTVIVLLILGGGVIGVQLALKRARHLTGKDQPVTETKSPANAEPPNPFAAQGYKVSPVKLTSTPGSKLVSACGTVRNIGAQARYGLRIELDLLDASGHRVGGATDYMRVLEPNEVWSFNAMVSEPKAVAAEVAALKETK